jgi:hypothetical protein
MTLYSVNLTIKKLKSDSEGIGCSVLLCSKVVRLMDWTTELGFSNCKYRNYLGILLRCEFCFIGSEVELDNPWF